MLVVTHEMSFARDVASEVIFLHQGRIEEEGAPGRVFANPKSDRCASSSPPRITNRAAGSLSVSRRRW